MSISSIEQSKRIIGERVELFQRNFDQYHRPEYKEAQLRREFLDPFFEALGWDVSNRQGYAEQYKEVVNEDALKVGESMRAPDYAFRIGDKRVFFVEAKKPSRVLKSDASSAYQLRRYAWSAKLALSILTDFEELAIYDCRARPVDSDAASVGRLSYFTFDQYLDRFSELYDVFSKEANLRGGYDRFIADTKSKRGTQSVDAAFLNEIEEWRLTLARNIAQLNPRLTLDEMNDAVQRTIDRIIFLRMAEDRGVEEYEQLKNLTGFQNLSGLGNVYTRFLKLCRDADDKYNSGLFDFRTDTLTPTLKIDDDKLGAILAGLYLPKSPYVFNELANDTLGNVYEQFLGKVIRLTPAHQAKVEEKPEVRHANGVHYTPAFIGRSLAQNTLGKMLAGKSPDEISGVGKFRKTPLRVLDISCGSGTLLLCAFEMLLDFYLNWYVAHRDDKRSRDKIYESVRGWRLTTQEKKRILTTHVFGVDIDRQAVEVTKLSLLLKVLEDETQETIGKQLSLFKERALPNLDKNIVCGNSLIGTDYFAGQLMPDRDEMRRVNPMDWATAFPDVFASRPDRFSKTCQVSDDVGFDCIIGNPPYVRIQVMKEWAPLEVEIYKEKYTAARSGNYDIYVVFVEKALQLLNANGRMGFILPHKFFNAQYGEPLRGLIAQGKHLAKVVHFGDQQVFAGATTYTCLMFLDKRGRDECEFSKVDNLQAWRDKGTATEGTIPASSITSAEWNFAVGKSAALFERLSKMPVKLGDVADIFVGLQTSADDVFILDLIEETQRTLRLNSKSLDAEWTFEKGLLFPIVSGTDVKRYAKLSERQYIIFPYQVENETATLLDWETIAKKYPRTTAYFEANKKQLEDRERGKFKGRDWYRFGRNQNIGIQERVKLCVPRLVEKLYAAYDIEGNHFLDNVDVGGLTLKPECQKHSLGYLLGLLNSAVLRWYFPFVSAPFRGGWRSANRQFLSQLPIRTIDFANAQDKASHDRIIKLVEQMLALHPQLASAKTAQDRELIQRQITATDNAIDALVYELYGLSEQEIEIIAQR